MVGLLLALSTVTFIDRVNISIAGKGLMGEFHIDSVTMGTIFSAFVFGYALFQIPGGWLGDKYGPRRLLTCVVIWWSIFTVLTAVAGNWFLVGILGIVGSFMTVRFLVGVGEAAAYPNFNRMIANWMAPTERALGVAIANAGLGVGAALAPPLVAWIMVNYGWRASFYVTGVIGIVVVLIWYRYATDHPDQHKSVNAAELAFIRGGEEGARAVKTATPAASMSWGRLLRNSQIWLIVAAYTLYGYILYVYLSWFYLYLVNVKKFSILKGALYSTLPFLAMAILAPIGGYISDRSIKRFGRKLARRSVAITGLVLCTVFIYFGAKAEEPMTAIIMLSLGAGFLYFTSGVFWSSCTDIAKAHTGTVSGMMNMGANIGGTISPIATPFLAKTYGWEAAIQVAAVCAFVAAALWLFINAEKQLTVAPPAAVGKAMRS
jgi:ACS family glucarate transporter-like MFS transporter